MPSAPSTGDATGPAAPPRGANARPSLASASSIPPAIDTSSIVHSIDDGGPSYSTTASTTTASTAVKWADQVGKSAAGATTQVAAGATKMVGWTFENAKLETATGSKGLRPMHVRVSVRVHHVTFLHPGLDNGGRATIGERRNGKWYKKKMTKKKATHNGGPPGLLNFGSKKGTWKNPISPKSHPNKVFGVGGVGGLKAKLSNEEDVASKLRKDLENEENDVNEASEISEIISAEAFRLSRDGIIQHHYALNHASPQQQPSSQPATQPVARGPYYSLSPGAYPGSKRRLNMGAQNPQANNNNNNQHPSIMLSPYSAANPEDAARYYKECAERPKGYRRLVVSSAVPTHDVPIPPPPPTNPKKVASGSHALSPRSSRGNLDAGTTNKRMPRKLDTKAGRRFDEQQRASSSTWSFQKDVTAIDAAEKEEKKDVVKNENLFDNVEYQYIGPPQTGPEFFQLLRTHGAATFGRYLPELACSVPNHSIGFEIGKHKSKRRKASTQPLVVEAPHVIWGDARDKMLSRIAKEGCPLIDSRKFEYVSNAALDETEMSESLMVFGSTLWVQNADEDDASLSSVSTLKPHYTKGMVKAEYYGGKFVDGVKDGLSVGMKGLTKGTKGTIHATKDAGHVMKKGTKDTAHVISKGTKDAAHSIHKVSKTLVPIPHDRELASESTTQAPTEAPTEAQTEGRPPKHKGSRIKALFNPKKLKMKNRLRRRPRRSSGEDGGSLDGSIASELDDDHSSVGGDSVATDSSIAGDYSAHSADTLKGKVPDEDFDTNAGHDEVSKTRKDDLGEDFSVVKPVPYDLLLDDIIDIRIVSFPDKDNVIAHFPISVASVMVQSDMHDRTSDPLKPSELTATLIQEPSAKQLQWGVELKVTLRAVEVKPKIPRVVPRPKDVIDEEMSKMKERLKLLGKTPVDIKKDLQAKEEEIINDENDLNQAIVAYGYGKGEDEGAGLSEVRLRQMFYCEREHGAISRKMKRRSLLTEDEKKMMNDAKIDPSSLKRGYEKFEKQKLLELLDVHFPGIEEEEVSAIEGSVRFLGTLVNSGTAASTQPVLSKGSDSLAKASLMMAHSLDSCLAGLTEKPTVTEVEQRLRHTITEGIRPDVTKEVAKEWCSSVAEKLSSHVRKSSVTDVSVKSSIAKLQSIIAESTLASGNSFEESVDETKEEMKLDEDEIALSQTTQSGDLDSSKLLDWVTAVASQLEAYAEELDGDQVSIAYSDTLSAIAPTEEEKSMLSSFDGGSMGAGEDPPGFDGGRRSSGVMIDQEPQNEPEGESSDSVSSPTIQKSTESDADEDVWEKILSQKMTHKMRPPSRSSLRFNSATSISSVKNALPRSKTMSKNEIAPLLKKMKKSHGHSHQVDMQTTSLSATLIYLSVILTLFSLVAYGGYVMSQGLWSMMYGTN